MEVFEQLQWLGIAKKSMAKLHPWTSQSEINTLPGKEELTRLPARVPYLSTPLYPHAWSIENRNEYMYCRGTTNPDSDYSAFSFVAHVCFKWDGMDETSTSIEPVIFGSINGPSPGSSITNIAWCLLARYDSGWKLVFRSRTGSSTVTELVSSTTTITKGTWYWVSMWANALTQVTSMDIYTNGSAVVSETATTPSVARTAFTGTYYLVLGGNPIDYGQSFYRGKIAFAACRGVTPAEALPSTPPWEACVARSGQSDLSRWYDYSFVPFDPKKTYFPGQLDDDKYYTTWWHIPKGQFYSTVTTTAEGALYAASGYYSFPGDSPKIMDYYSPDLFTKKTVFIFNSDTFGDQTLLRAEDSSFEIDIRGKTTAESFVSVLWTPALTSAAAAIGFEPRCRQAESRSLSVWPKDTASYIYPTNRKTNDLIAVQVDPSVNFSGHLTTANVAIFKWCTLSAQVSPSVAAWVDITNYTAGPTVAFGTKGIYPPNATKWVLTENFGYYSRLYDFRIVVGDDDWQTNHTPDTVTTSVPGQVAVWLQMDTTGRFPRSSNVNTLIGQEMSDQGTAAIAYSNRVDGAPIFTISPFSGHVAWDGCPYITNAPRPAVNDILVSGDRDSVEACTDAYYLDGSTYRARFASSYRTRSVASPMGALRYTSGSGPLQLISPTNRLVGWEFARVTAAPSGNADSSATIDDEGALTDDTSYRFVATLYDPSTGNESNPYGPFRFTTSAKENRTCAFRVVMTIRAHQSLEGQEMRFYRYADGGGTYYLEGSSKITGWTYSGGKFLQNCYFTFGLEESLLTIQKEVEYDNDSPPLHSYATIWASRAWYVPTLYQSRIYYSKVGQVGCVPLSNLVWTDEGTGGSILGTLQGFGGLILLRERSIWVIPQFGADTEIYATPIIPNIGCVSGDAAVFANGVLYWASPAGICSFDGQNIVDYSDKLNGVDQKVWDHNPRATTAWYERSKQRVVFSCEGSAISVHTLTGSVALLADPASCATDVVSSSYAGVLYGADGNIWKETSGNLSLDLSSAGAACSRAIGPLSVTAASFTRSINWYCFAIGGNSSARVGFRDTNLSATAFTYLAPTTFLGRNLTVWDVATDQAWSQVVTVGERDGTYYFRGSQPMVGEWFLGRTPWYYLSQENTVNQVYESKILERMDFATGSGVGSTADCFVSLFTRLPGAVSAQSVTATAAVTDNSVFTLPLRIRGTWFYWVCQGYPTQSMPPIRSVRAHYRVIRPRGRR